MIATPKKRCAIYTRKSTSAGLEQEFNSLDAQREACEAYIRSQAQQGWEKAGCYEDGGFTGANIERPGFQRLLKDADEGKIDVVVVYKVDRLSRSLLDFAQVMNHFNQHGVAFVSVTQNFSTADAMGRLTLNMLMSFAEFEREMIAERTRDKMRAARRKGKWTGGAVPLGYDLVDHKLVVNELEAMTVREIFSGYLEKRSSLSVVRDLEANGRTNKQRLSRTGRQHQPKPWDQDAVLRILKNPVYAGMMSCGPERHEGEHPALIDRETFERVQVLLESKKRSVEVAPSRYLLKGLVRCGLCQGSMTPASTRKGEHEYRYYRCLSRTKRGKESCASTPVPAEKLEARVVARIRERAATATLAADVGTALQTRTQHLEERLKHERQLLAKSIAQLSAEAGELANSVSVLSGAARQTMEARTQNVVGRLSQQEARLAEVERELAALENHRADAAWTSRLLSDFDRMWEVMTPESRQRMVFILIDHVEVNEEKGTLTTVLADLDDQLPLAKREAEVA